MQHPIDDTKETITFRAVSKDKEGRKHVEKIKTDTHNIETLKHIEKKMVDKGLQRQERHPVDGRPLGRQAKGGQGRKFTWEGPADAAANELDEPAPAAIDENDPNYVDEEAEGRILRGEVSGVAGLVVGEVEVPKLAEEGVARIEFDPQLRCTVMFDEFMGLTFSKSK